MKKMSLHAKAILAARESRYTTKQRFMQELSKQTPNSTCLEICMNIPGRPKVGNNWRRVFKAGLQQLKQKLPVQQQQTFVDKAGYYALLSTTTEISLAKKMSCHIEEARPWGRLLDIDCINQHGRLSRPDLGLPDRRCMVCLAPQEICLSAKTHTLTQSRSAAIDLAATVDRDSCTANSQTMTPYH